MRTRFGQLLIMALPPLTLFILLIVIWQITTGLASVPSFLLPAPRESLKRHGFTGGIFCGQPG